MSSYKDAMYKGWSEKDIEHHKSIDWVAVNYREVPDKRSVIKRDCYIYGLGRDVVTRKISFVKMYRANPIYPPYYSAVIPEDLREFMSENNIVGGMFDGRTYNGYNIHDRFETQRLYNILTS